MLAPMIYYFHRKNNYFRRKITMSQIKFYNRTPVPVEMHKVKIVQKLSLLPARERLAKAKGHVREAIK